LLTLGAQFGAFFRWFFLRGRAEGIGAVYKINFALDRQDDMRDWGI